MAEPFLSEIRIMSFGFPPKGWALCDGQLLPINQNQALFSLLGTTYGGDGRVDFALPNLQGRLPIHMGSGHTLGERSGEQAHALSITEIPTHTHVVMGSTLDGNQAVPTGNVLAEQPHAQFYRRSEQPDEPPSGHCRKRRRHPGSPQHAAVPRPQLLRSPSRASSRARPRRSRHGPTLRRRNPDVRGQLCPGGLDVLRRPASAHLRKRNAVLSSSGRRTAATARATFALPDLRGGFRSTSGSGFTLAETGGVEDGHADREPERRCTAIAFLAAPMSQPSRARRGTSPAQLPTAEASSTLRPRRASQHEPVLGVLDRGKPAARRTSSHISASISSSRSSGSSRAQT